MGSPVHVLGNRTARAGKAGEALEVVLAALEAAGHEVVELAPASREEVRPQLAQALRDGAERVVIAGGDGLVHLAVQELAGTGVPVGIVPIGTGNDFSRALGIPSGVTAAVEAALSDPVDLDLIRTDHAWVASVATLGFSAVVNARANHLAWPRGSSRYTLATLLELPRLRPLAMRLDVDGEAHELEATLVAIGNTAYFGGGMKICRSADPTDGRLDVTVIGAVGRLQLLRILPRAYKPKESQHGAVTFLSGSRIRLELAGGADSEASHLWGDGDPVGPLPVTVEAVPGALRLAGVRLPVPG